MTIEIVLGNPHFQQEGGTSEKVSSLEVSEEDQTF